MIKKSLERRTTLYEFDGVTELIGYIKNTERTDFYKTDHVSDAEGDANKRFTGTESFAEAEDMLLHGWDKKAEELNKKLSKTICNVGNKTKTKTVYGMQGFQACVPRYLQGMPDSMISTRKVQQKQKVLNIVKEISYGYKTSRRKIENESLKVFRLVQRLESEGYRVNLKISLSLMEAGKKVIVLCKIKNSGQKLNIKQTVFPMVHPSMLRRIMLALIERMEETKDFGKGYGSPAGCRYELRDCYYLPAIIYEDEITNIEQYGVK